MKRIGIIAAVLGLLNLLGLLVYCGFSIEEKVHYIRQRSAITYGTIIQMTPTSTVTTSANSVDSADYSSQYVPPPTDHPPLTIVCGIHTFQVVYVNSDWLMKGSNAWAETRFKERLIVLGRQRDAVGVREDMVHELMHVALWESGGVAAYGPTGNEDNYIKPMAPSFRDILIDNPGLLKWLVKAGG